MKKKIMIAIISIVIIVGTIFVVREISKTGVTALDDSFTREFLDEEVEVGDGFYFYEARNGQYTMWFPQGFYITNDSSFFQSNEEIETVRLLSGDSKTYDESIQMNYRGRSHESESTIESRFEDLLDAISYESEYEEIQVDGNTIYYGSSYQELMDRQVINMNPNDNNPNAYFGMVVNDESNQFITLRYLISCEKEDCVESKEKLDSFFEQIVRSVKFK